MKKKRKCLRMVFKSVGTVNLVLLMTPMYRLTVPVSLSAECNLLLFHFLALMDRKLLISDYMKHDLPSVSFILFVISIDFASESLT